MDFTRTSVAPERVLSTPEDYTAEGSAFFPITPEYKDQHLFFKRYLDSDVGQWIAFPVIQSDLQATIVY